MAAEYLQRMGERMAERRKELGLTQEQVARSLPGETSGTHVSRWERGLHRPSDDTLEALAKVLRVDVAYFLAAQADTTAGTPDPFAGRDQLGLADQLDRVERTVADIARREEVASTEREDIRALLAEQSKILGSIAGLLERQEEILLKMQRVAEGLPDDENLRRLNAAARELTELAARGPEARREPGQAPAGSRRRAVGEP